MIKWTTYNPYAIMQGSKLYIKFEFYKLFFYRILKFIFLQSLAILF
jgi:hypothetical protein